MSKLDLKLLSFFSLVLFSVIQTSAIPDVPEPVRLIKELKSTSFHEQQRIYRKILQDTSLLKHKGLQEELIKVGREGWLKQYLYFFRFSGDTDPVKFDDETTATKFNIYLSILSRIPNDAIGHQPLKLKMYLSANGISWNNALARQIKRDNHSLRILVQKGPDPKYGFGRKEKRQLLPGVGFFNQVVFEAYRFNRDKMTPALVRKLIKWSIETVQDPFAPLSLKHTAVAILLHEGFSENEILAKYKISTDGRFNGWTKQQLADRSIQKANEFQKEYPRWPISD